MTPESHVKKPHLKVDFLLGVKRPRLCTVQLTDGEPVRLREPRPGDLKRPRKGLVLSGAYTIDNTPENVLRDIATLIDLGCEVLAVAGWEIFDAMYYTKTEFPIRLVGAGDTRLAGGSQLVKCSVSLPVWHDERNVTVKCVQVTVHLASVGPRVILGYPFRACYGLTLSPARGSLVFDDVPHEEHIPDEPSADVEDQHSGVKPVVQNLMDQDQLADSNRISQVQDQDQLTESSPIFQVHDVSNTPNLQSQDLDINSDDADENGPHPKRDPTLDAVMVTPERSTRGGEERAWNYYIDIAAVVDSPEEHHAKTEVGDHPSSDGSSDEGALGFDPTLGFIGSLGYLCASEGQNEGPYQDGPCCTPSTISRHSYGLASHQVLHDLALSCTISHKK